MIVLDEKDVIFRKSIDKVGQIFFYQDRIFRKISNESREFVQELINSDVFKQLVEKKYFVNTWISEFTFDDGSLVVEHEKIFIMPPNTWTFNMLKNCACFALELAQFLKPYGLTLFDGHYYNFAMIDGKPILFDLGTIIKGDGKNFPFYVEFLKYFIMPLLLYSHNELELGKLFLSSGRPTKSYFLNKMFLKFFSSYSNVFLKLVILFYCCLPEMSLFDKLKREIERFLRRRYRRQLLPVKAIKKLDCNYGKSQWGDYYSRSIKKMLIEKDNVRFNTLVQYIKEYASSARSTVDVAGNQGIISFMIDDELPFIKRKLNCDYYEPAIDLSYIYIYRNNKSEIFSLNCNFMQESSDFINNLKSDIVLALAVTHHLILTQQYRIEDIFEQLKRFSNKYVFIEFMPLGLWNGKNMPELPDWYNFDWFKSNFEKYFKILKIDHYEKNRILFIGEIIG